MVEKFRAYTVEPRKISLYSKQAIDESNTKKILINNNPMVPKEESKVDIKQLFPEAFSINEIAKDDQEGWQFLNNYKYCKSVFEGD